MFGSRGPRAGWDDRLIHLDVWKLLNYHFNFLKMFTLYIYMIENYVHNTIHQHNTQVWLRRKLLKYIKNNKWQPNILKHMDLWGNYVLNWRTKSLVLSFGHNNTTDFFYKETNYHCSCGANPWLSMKSESQLLTLNRHLWITVKSHDLTCIILAAYSTVNALLNTILKIYKLSRPPAMMGKTF